MKTGLTTRPLQLLTSVSPGKCVRVHDVTGGDGLRARLCALGLTPGIPVKVITVGQGPVILNVMGARLMLGHGMAEKIMVKEIGPDSGSTSST